MYFEFALKCARKVRAQSCYLCLFIWDGGLFWYIFYTCSPREVSFYNVNIILFITIEGLNIPRYKDPLTREKSPPYQRSYSV